MDLKEGSEGPSRTGLSIALCPLVPNVARWPEDFPQFDSSYCYLPYAFRAINCNGNGALSGLVVASATFTIGANSPDIISFSKIQEVCTPQQFTANGRNYIYESGPPYTKWAMNNGGRNIYRPAFGGGVAPYDQPDNFGSSIAMMWWRGNPSNDGADDVCFRACCTFEQRDRDGATNNYRYLGGLEVP